MRGAPTWLTRARGLVGTWTRIVRHGRRFGVRNLLTRFLSRPPTSVHDASAAGRPCAIRRERRRTDLRTAAGGIKHRSQAPTHGTNPGSNDGSGRRLHSARTPLSVAADSPLLSTLTPVLLRPVEARVLRIRKRHGFLQGPRESFADLVHDLFLSGFPTACASHVGRVRGRLPTEDCASPLSSPSPELRV